MFSSKILIFEKNIDRKETREFTSETILWKLTRGKFDWGIHQGDFC